MTRERVEIPTSHQTRSAPASGLQNFHSVAEQCTTYISGPGRVFRSARAGYATDGMPVRDVTPEWPL